MRLKFFECLYEEMILNENIVFVTGDLGYFFADKIKKDFPERFINVGAAEVTMIGLGIGLALQNKIAVCYSITPFLLDRPFESIKLYIDGERIPVKLVGSGRGKDYEHDGASHWESEFNFKNILHLRPEDKELMPEIVKSMLYNGNPTYLNLKR